MDEIKILRKQLLRAQKKIAYYQSPNFLLQITELLTGTYSLLLNPPSFEIKSTLGQKACVFKVNVKDVVCVLSDERSKFIYLKTSQKSIDGILHETDKIVINETVEKTCKRLDSARVHLVKVSPRAAINVAYYDLDKDKLLLNLHNYTHSNCIQIPITAHYLNDFKAKKSDFEDKITLQKTLSVYK